MTRPMLWLSAATALIAATSGCKTPNAASATKSVTADAAAPGGAAGNVAFLFFNGFGTCGGPFKPVDGPAYQLAESVRQGLQNKIGAAVPFVYSCYTSQNAIFAVTSANPRATQLASPDDLVRLVESVAVGPDPWTVYVVGHSYGGWTAMRTVTMLDPRITVAALVTSDPISRVACVPQLIANSMLGNREPAPECTEPPADLDGSQVASRVGVWHNFYQLNFRFLHSGPIAQATANQQLDMRTGPFLKFKAHENMAKDQTLWSDVAALTNQ